MRQWNEDAVGLFDHRADDLAERDLPNEPLDRELTNPENDAGVDQRDLSLQPLGTVRDLGGTGRAVPRPTRGLPGKALRDRGAIRKFFTLCTLRVAAITA